VNLVVVTPEPPRLVALAASAVRQPLDLFRCEPYRCSLTAKTCVARQDQIAAPKDRRPGAYYRADSPAKGDFFLCIDCAVGAVVRKGLAS
jgi:hypothetical protein